MSTLAVARQVTSRADTQDWRIALGALSLVVVAPWFAFGLLLVSASTSPDSNPYVGNQGARMAATLHEAGLIGAAMLVFAVILVPLPVLAAWRARRLRVVVAACALTAALSVSPVVAFVVLVTTSDRPFMNIGG